MASDFSVSMTDTATEDLREILSYISVTLSNPTAAKAFYEQFIEAVDRIALFPESGSLLLNESVRERDVRKILVKNYLVYYRVNQEKQNVRILTIFHNHRNAADILMKLDI